MFSCVAASTQPCNPRSASIVRYYDAEHVVANTQPCEPTVQYYDADHVVANTQPCTPCTASVVQYYDDDHVLRLIPAMQTLFFSVVQ